MYPFRVVSVSYPQTSRASARSLREIEKRRRSVLVVVDLKVLREGGRPFEHRSSSQCSARRLSKCRGLGEPREPRAEQRRLACLSSRVLLSECRWEMTNCKMKPSLPTSSTASRETARPAGVKGGKIAELSSHHIKSISKPLQFHACCAECDLSSLVEKVHSASSLSISLAAALSPSFALSSTSRWSISSSSFARSWTRSHVELTISGDAVWRQRWKEARERRTHSRKALRRACSHDTPGRRGALACPP